MKKCGLSGSILGEIQQCMRAKHSLLRRLEAILSLAVLGMPPDARKNIRGCHHA
jgi:hypothetical protein